MCCEGSSEARLTRLDGNGTGCLLVEAQHFAEHVAQQERSSVQCHHWTNQLKALLSAHDK